MTDVLDTVPADVLRWVLAATAADAVESCQVTVLPGGAVSDLVERLTFRVAGTGAEVDLVRKRASAHEVAGLRAAQTVRDRTAVVPELVAVGRDPAGWWLVTPFHRGGPLDAGRAPEALFTGLAELHAAFAGRAVTDVPLVDRAWWRALVENWVRPGVRAAPDRHGPAAARRLEQTLDAVLAMRGDPLAGLTTTLLHGDVHGGNVLVDGDPVLIDWGSSRIGPAALDLANLVGIDSPQVAAYRSAWARRVGGEPDLERGYRWAALQIPVQYLPWAVDNRSTDDVLAMVDRIEAALAAFG